MKKEKIAIIIMAIMILMYTSFMIITRDTSWYYDFAKVNKDVINNWVYSKPSEKCVVTKFAVDEKSYNLGPNREYPHMSYYFNYKDTEIQLERSFADSIYINYSVNEKDVVINHFFKDSKNPNIVILTTKLYDISNKKIKYATAYYILSSSPEYGINNPYFREDLTEIPDNEIPEYLKEIDLKEKIDEVDKKLEKRWNETCGTKSNK